MLEYNYIEKEQVNLKWNIGWLLNALYMYLFILLQTYVALFIYLSYPTIYKYFKESNTMVYS